MDPAVSRITSHYSTPAPHRHVTRKGPSVAIVSSTLAYKPFFLEKDSGEADPIYYSAADFTRFFSGILPRSGILGSSHFLVAQADNVGMSIKVNSGYANVGGRYLVHLAEDITIDVSSFSNPTGTRTHLVYLSVYNALENGFDYDAKIDVVEDTGTGAVTPPSANEFLQLATITVTPNQGLILNTNINNTVRHGGMAGEYVYLAPYLDSAFTVAGTETGTFDFRGRYENGRVWLSGAIKRANGTHFANGGSYDLGTMLSNFRPVRTFYLPAASSIYNSGSDDPGTYYWRLSIDKNGAMNARVPPTTGVPAGSGPSYLFFDGISYDLD